MASFFFLDFFERLPVGLIGHLFGQQRLQHLRFRLRLSAWLASAWLGLGLGLGLWFGLGLVLGLGLELGLGLGLGLESGLG